MDRRTRAALHGIALSVSCLLAGCVDSDDGEFHSYSELQSERPAVAPGAATDAASGDSSTSKGADPVSSAADTTVGNSPGSVPASSGGMAETVTTPPVTTGNDRIAGPPAVAAPAEAVPLEQPAPTQPVAALERRLDAIPVEAPRPEPREITLLVPHREFREEGPEGAIRVSYDDIDLLKVLNMEPVPGNCVDYFPDWLRNLDGRRIRIRGFMYPPFETTGIRGFVLARDNQICCFGRYPKRYDVIDVFLRRGVTTDYIQNRPFDVVGTFHIQPEDDDGELYQLYVIDDAIVVDP